MEIQTIGVIGAGTMGHGIAHVSAMAGYRVLLYDTKLDLAEKGRQKIEVNLDYGVKKGKVTQSARDEALERISLTEALSDMKGCQLIIEAVPEKMDLKQKLFSDLAQLLPPTAILATNTSSLSVTEIAAPTPNPERVVGMHFFNPVPAMRLVEIVTGPSTDPAAVRRAEEISERLGKTPIRVADTPGFVVNRVARPFYLEALRIVEACGEPEQVDAAIREAGFRMGPLQLADLIGNDINLAVSESLFERYYFQPRFRPSYLQRSMVEAGLLGRKSGRGFYDYGSEDTERAEETPAPSEDVALRVISCIVNEAFLTLSEGVATADDIDLAMKLGANYPKGPFEWAEEIGSHAILETLDSLRAAHGDAYLACSLLRERALEGPVSN